MTEQKKDAGLVSFIVPAWNEEAVLGPTLKSIHAAGRDIGIPYEIVVSDDASDDRTAEIATSNGARLTTQLRRQIAGTRNAGARVAHGDIFIFVDADTHISAPVLKATIRAVQDGAAGGGCAVQFDHVPRRLSWIVRSFTWLYRKSRLAAGCYVFCTRQAFEHTGGFDERFYAGEEVMLSARLRRYGKFLMLRENVVTSARKLRTFTLREYLRAFSSLSPRFPFRREGKAMELWYGPRRQDPRLPHQPGG